jgi:hypothetical protein
MRIKHKVAAAVISLGLPMLAVTGSGTAGADAPDEIAFKAALVSAGIPASMTGDAVRMGYAACNLLALDPDAGRAAIAIAQAYPSTTGAQAGIIVGAAQTFLC